MAKRTIQIGFRPPLGDTVSWTSFQIEKWDQRRNVDIAADIMRVGVIEDSSEAGPEQHVFIPCHRVVQIRIHGPEPKIDKSKWTCCVCEKDFDGDRPPDSRCNPCRNRPGASTHDGSYCG